MKHANPYLNFDGNAREAFEHYRDVFGSDFVTAMTFREFGGEQMGIDGAMLDRLAHIALEADTGEEAERVFTRLSDGGSTEMPLQKVEWAEQFGICRDRYGVQWMVSYTGAVTFGQ